jgi:hypothetical protein
LNAKLNHCELESRQLRRVMGLAEDLKALQELRDKGELSESAYATARDAAVEKAGSQPVAKAKTKPIISKFTKLFLAAVILLVGFSFFINIYVSATKNQSTNLFHQSETVTDEIENVPAASWKAINYNFPSGGKLDITIRVVNGNPIDVSLIPADQMDTSKQGGWRTVKSYDDFSATKTTTYHRTAHLRPGSYYLVLRDTSLGILSSRASDVSVKTILTP